MKKIAYGIAGLVVGLTLAGAAQAGDEHGRGHGRGRPTFEQLDKNGDGKITASEVPAHVWERLKLADTNKDNAVTKAEFEAAMAARKGRGGPGKPHLTFEQMDKNGDGKIVASEVPAEMWRWISRADANKDNAVTKAEWEAMKSQRRGHHGRGRK